MGIFPFVFNRSWIETVIVCFPTEVVSVFLKTAYISKRIFHIKHVDRRVKSVLIYCFGWFLKAVALRKMSKMESEFRLTYNILLELQVFLRYYRKIIYIY